MFATFATFALVVAGVVVGGAGCATTTAATASTGVHARDFVPLAVGNRWTYELQPAPSPDAARAEVKIVDRDQQGFFIDDKGGRLAPRTDGVFDGVKNRFLIEEPVEPGHEWIAVPKDDPSIVEHYKIVDVSSQVHVPAGNFEGCVEVEASQEIKNPQTGEKGTLKTNWSYAPGVGLVKLVQKIVPEKSQPFTTATMTLVSFEVKRSG